MVIRFVGIILFISSARNIVDISIANVTKMVLLSHISFLYQPISLIIRKNPVIAVVAVISTATKIVMT